MHLIKRPCATPQPREPCPEPHRVFLEIQRIGEACSHTRHEHKPFGRVREPEVSVREGFEHVAGNVVDENHHKAEATEHIEARIALFHKGHNGALFGERDSIGRGIGLRVSRWRPQRKHIGLQHHDRRRSDLGRGGEKSWKTGA